MEGNPPLKWLEGIVCGAGSVLDFGFIIIIISPKCLLSQCIVFTRAAANDYF